MIEPTEEGKKRYPKDEQSEAGYYYDHVFETTCPCTCTPDCDDPCHGTYHPATCNCQACGLIYGDFLSGE